MEAVLDALLLLFAQDPAERMAGRRARSLLGSSPGVGVLDSMDFTNRGILFAATLFLCFFPFLIVANALAGRSAATGLARYLALNQLAAADVGSLFTSSAATSSAVTGTAWVCSSP